MATGAKTRGMTPDEVQAHFAAKRRKRMEEIDALPEGLRLLVHEYGYPIIRAFLDIGVSKPRHIRHIVEMTLNEFSPTRGSSSVQSTVLGHHRRALELTKAKPFEG